MTIERKKLGKYCAPNHDVGNALCAWIPTSKGTLLSRISVIPLMEEKRNSNIVKKKIQDFESSFNDKLKESYELLKLEDETPEPDLYRAVDENDTVIKPLLEAGDIKHEPFDQYLSARVGVLQGDNMSYRTVPKTKGDSQGELMAHSNTNPFLDTCLY